MNSPTHSQPTLYRLRCASALEKGGPLTFAFADPVPRQISGAAETLAAPPIAGATNARENLDILVVPVALKDDRRWREGVADWLARPDQSPAISVRAGEIQVSWQPGRAVIVAPPTQAGAALDAVVDFAYYENELRSLEEEIASAWPAVAADTPLAYDITKADLARDKEIGLRARQVLHHRMRHARIDAQLCRPPARFAHLPAELGEALRDAARCAERAETADGQIEVREYVYEMAGQRLGEFRHARQGFIMEAIIIALLAGEVVLLLLGEIR